MLKSKLLKMLLIGSCLALTSCAHVKVYNRRVYGDLGVYGAHWAETLTDATGDVDKESWDKLRVGMLCMDSQAYTNVETALDQACVLVKCDYQTMEALHATFIKMRRLINAR